MSVQVERDNPLMHEFKYNERRQYCDLLFMVDNVKETVTEQSRRVIFIFPRVTQTSNLRAGIT